MILLIFLLGAVIFTIFDAYSKTRSIQVTSSIHCPPHKWKLVDRYGWLDDNATSDDPRWKHANLACKQCGHTPQSCLAGLRNDS